MIRLAAVLLLCSTLASAQLLVVLNKTDNEAVFVDPATMKVVGKTTTGVGPHEGVGTDDGKTVYVANYGAQQAGSSISVIDVASRKELRKIDVAPLLRPHGITLVNGDVYFTAEGSRAIARYSPAKDKVDWIAGTGQSVSHMIVSDKAGKRFWVANIAEGTVTFLDAANPNGPQGMKHIKVGAGAEGIDISPDGKEVWVATREDGHVHILDAATNTVRKSWNAGRVPIRVKFTPDGSKVLVSNAQGGDVVIYEAATQREMKRLAIGEAPVGIQLSRDGKWAFIAATGSGTVTKIDLEKLATAGTVKTGNQPDGMAWAETK